MRIHLIAVGSPMPTWVEAGFTEYAVRLPRECALHLTEIPAVRRGKKADVERVLREEGKRILAAIPSGTRVIALDVAGRQWDTGQLASQLAAWLRDGRDVTLLIGGPEGLDSACRNRAETAWSLSSLTFPHTLIRIMVAEQLYRAWSILHNHPYHRF